MPVAKKFKVKKANSSRITLSVTKGLHRKVQAHKEVNWSRVLRDAIRLKLRQLDGDEGSSE